MLAPAALAWFLVWCETCAKRMFRTTQIFILRGLPARAPGERLFTPATRARCSMFCGKMRESAFFHKTYYIFARRSRASHQRKRAKALRIRRVLNSCELLIMQYVYVNEGNECILTLDSCQEKPYNLLR